MINAEIRTESLPISPPRHSHPYEMVSSPVLSHRWRSFEPVPLPQQELGSVSSPTAAAGRGSNTSEARSPVRAATTKPLSRFVQSDTLPSAALVQNIRTPYSTFSSTWPAKSSVLPWSPIKPHSTAQPPFEQFSFEADPYSAVSPFNLTATTLTSTTSSSSSGTSPTATLTGGPRIPHRHHRHLPSLPVGTSPLTSPNATFAGSTQASAMSISSDVAATRLIKRGAFTAPPRPLYASAMVSPLLRKPPLHVLPLVVDTASDHGSVFGKTSEATTALHKQLTSPLKMNRKVMMETISRNRPCYYKTEDFDELHAFTRRLMKMWPRDSSEVDDDEEENARRSTKRSIFSLDKDTLSSSSIQDEPSISATGIVVVSDDGLAVTIDQQHHSPTANLGDEESFNLRNDREETARARSVDANIPRPSLNTETKSDGVLKTGIAETPRVDTYEDYGFLPDKTVQVTEPSVESPREETSLPNLAQPNSARQTSAIPSARESPTRLSLAPDATKRSSISPPVPEAEADQAEAAEERMPETGRFPEAEHAAGFIIQGLFKAIDQKIQYDEDAEKATRILQRVGRGHLAKAMVIPTVAGAYAEKFMRDYHQRLMAHVCAAVLSVSVVAAVELRASRLLWLKTMLTEIVGVEASGRQQIEQEWVQSMAHLLWQQNTGIQQIHTLYRNLAVTTTEEANHRKSLVEDQQHLWALFANLSQTFLARVQVELDSDRLVFEENAARNEIVTEQHQQWSQIVSLSRDSRRESVRHAFLLGGIRSLESVESQSRQRLELTAFECVQTLFQSLGCVRVGVATSPSV